MWQRLVVGDTLRFLLVLADIIHRQCIIEAVTLAIIEAFIRVTIAACIIAQEAITIAVDIIIVVLIILIECIVAIEAT